MFGFSEIDAQDRCFTSSVAAVHLRLHIPLPSVFCISPKISSCNQLFKTSWHYMNQSFILQKLRQSLYMYHKFLMLSYFSPIQGFILACAYLWNSKYCWAPDFICWRHQSCAKIIGASRTIVSVSPGCHPNVLSVQWIRSCFPLLDMSSSYLQIEWTPPSINQLWWPG